MGIDDSTRALVRDEFRLRTALEAHRERVHDAAATEDLQHRLEDVLESVQRVALDDRLWASLKAGVRVPEGSDAVDELAEIAWLGLPPLLEAVGYRSPPRPSATEVVDEAVAALAEVAELDAATRSRAPQIVAAARRRLVKLRMKVLSRIDRASPVTRPSVVRREARAVGGTAQSLISTAVASIVGAGADVLFPGAGFTVKWVAKVGEKAVELITARFLADGLRLERQADPPSAREACAHGAPPADLTPVQTHVMALTSALQDARRFSAGPSRELERRVAVARRHYDRIVELEGKPPDWCAVHEKLDLRIARLEKLSRSPELCQTTHVATHEAYELAARLA